MITKLNCLADIYPDEAHYGFVEFKKGERIIESYDYEMQYGQMAPYLMYFKDNTAHHLRSKNWSPKDIIQFMGNYTLESRWTEPVRRARNKVNLFIEYASKDIGNNRNLHQAYVYLRNNYNETWAFKNIVAPNFAQQIPRKTQGWTLIVYVITPVVLFTLYILHVIVKVIWRALGCSKKKDASKVAPADNK